jgi:hypothetical protein
MHHSDEDHADQRASSRRRTTVASSLWKVTRAKNPSICRNKRAVGGGGVAPQLVDRRGVGVVAQLEGPVEVRVHVMADHLALGGIRVDVAAEQRAMTSMGVAHRANTHINCRMGTPGRRAYRRVIPHQTRMSSNRPP